MSKFARFGGGETPHFFGLIEPCVHRRNIAPARAHAHSRRVTREHQPPLIALGVLATLLSFRHSSVLAEHPSSLLSGEEHPGFLGSFRPRRLGVSFVRHGLRDDSRQRRRRRQRAARHTSVSADTLTLRSLPRNRFYRPEVLSKRLVRETSRG